MTNASHVDGVDGHRMPNAMAPISTGIKPRIPMRNAKRPASCASHHPWRSTGRLKSLAMAPVRMCSTKVQRPHMSNVAPRPCVNQT